VKTVVTGATGHVGANLVRSLVAQGRLVRALVHVDRRAVEGLDIEVVEGDVCDMHSICRAFYGAEVVYHLSVHISLLMSEWSECEKVNVIGTRNVVEACLRCGVKRLVHFSSIHAFVQEPKGAPVDETRSLVDSCRCPPYDRSKAAGEKEVRKGIEKGLNAIIINPTGIIGPYDYRPSHFGEVLLSLAHGKMPALVDSGFDWVDARDVVEGAIQAEKLAPTGTQYILSGHWASIQEVAAMVEETSGALAPRLVFPVWIASLGIPLAAVLAYLSGKRPLFTSVSLMALCGNKNISHAKATQELGYSPRPLKETIADTIRWFEVNGQLTCQPNMKPER
jgi:dihydroflavonol-4-reductase